MQQSQKGDRNDLTEENQNPKLSVFSDRSGSSRSTKSVFEYGSSELVSKCEATSYSCCEYPTLILLVLSLMLQWRVDVHIFPIA